MYELERAWMYAKVAILYFIGKGVPEIRLTRHIIIAYYYIVPSYHCFNNPGNTQNET